MNNLKNRNAKNSERYSKPTFKKNKDGTVSYEYTVTRHVEYVHGGKMQSPDKNDIYKRTEYYSGKIFPDGLRKENKTTKEDVLIKKGRSLKKR